METKPLTLIHLFRREVRFVVPLFQRPYVWAREENWEPLWQDVMAAWHLHGQAEAEAPHFLGAIVLDLVKGQTDTTEVRQVIDGQQRLTTLQLLLAAVRDVASELALPERNIKSLQRLTVNDDEMSSDPDDTFKVWPTNADRGAFRNALSAGSAAALASRYPLERPTIVQAYLYFAGTVRDWLLQLDPADREGAFDQLVSVLNHGVQVVVIDLGSRDNPQVIFESLNARGTPLRASDLVRNHLFHEAERQGLQVQDLYDRHWARFDDGYWREDVRQGRLVRPRLDAFLGHFLTMELVQEVPAHQLFLTFRRYVRDSGLPLTDLMARFGTFGDVYSTLDTGAGLAPSEQVFLRRLAALDTTVIMPVLLLVFGRDNAATRRNVLQVLESYLLRRMICRLTTKNYNRLMLDLLRQLRPGQQSADDVVLKFLAGQTVDSNYWPSDEDVRYAVGALPLYKQLTRGRVRIILDLANRRLQTASTEQIIHDLDRLTIEHLLPQAWEQHWPLAATGTASRAEESARRHGLLHTLGNLTLTTQRLNQSVSNGPWMAKRKEILERSALNINRSLPEEWDDRAIQTRGASLASVLCDALPRPAATVRAAEHHEETEEVDDDPAAAPEIRSVAGRPGRRNVAKHILAVLQAHPVGAVLTVSQIANAASPEYPDADVSPGAVSQRLRAGNVSGVEATTNSAGSLAATLRRH
ncbi:DUF262 domain-containing protein [Dactylosporangium sp. NPDC048998]|uniref:DUF262 domain-containing protein n=1 Tax=Dactylosporangium sp. NPDC048998 TaxID=3363976 RepID=UPI0037240632